MYRCTLSHHLPYGAFLEFLLKCTFYFIMHYDKETNVAYKLIIVVDHPV